MTLDAPNHKQPASLSYLSVFWWPCFSFSFTFVKARRRVTCFVCNNEGHRILWRDTAIGGNGQGQPPAPLLPARVRQYDTGDSLPSRTFPSCRIRPCSTELVRNVGIAFRSHSNDILEVKDDENGLVYAYLHCKVWIRMILRSRNHPDATGKY